ncbi:MAG: hypothetical protein ASARMPRED_006594, partial [Alectoria sarmentosa]
GLLDQLSWYDADGPRSSTLDSHLIKSGYVFKELYRLNIWPISTRLDSINLDYIQRSIARFNEQDGTTFKWQLMNVIAKAVDAQKGLCLSCRYHVPFSASSSQVLFINLILYIYHNTSASIFTILNSAGSLHGTPPIDIYPLRSVKRMREEDERNDSDGPCRDGHLKPAMFTLLAVKM